MMITKKVKNNITWVDREKNIYEEDFSVTIYFIGIPVYRRYAVILHNTDQIKGENKMGFGK